jgi:hypothetical protein
VGDGGEVAARGDWWASEDERWGQGGQDARRWWKPHERQGKKKTRRSEKGEGRSDLRTKEAKVRECGRQEHGVSRVPWRGGDPCHTVNTCVDTYCNSYITLIGGIWHHSIQEEDTADI